MSKCDCNTYYLLSGRPQCLHQLFQSGVIKIITREVTRTGVEFYIYSEKPKEKSQAWKRGWWKNGSRSRVTSRDQILLAIELAQKHQTKRVRL
jgi:hypothetical protein